MAQRATTPPDTDEWAAWSQRVWDTLAARFDRPHMAYLEQRMMRSQREQRCVQCGDAGTVREDSGPHSLIHSVSHYWLCADCDAYYNERE